MLCPPFGFIEAERQRVDARGRRTRMSRVIPVCPRGRCLDYGLALRLRTRIYPIPASRQCGPIKPVQIHHPAPLFIARFHKLVLRS